ncbi:MAG: AmpG family muropeptide MFS transporter [Bacteroidales bacterium]|nr:AmpG family muropeptide MFS transporter [Bacteroidales bacterium]
MNRNPVKCNPWGWVPSLYFAEGLPYAIVISLSVVMYKELGLSNADATFYTGWFSLPWVFKPLWSPFVDLLKTKRWWIVTMQILMGVGMAGIAFTLPLDGWLQWSLAIFWLMAFSSATHDVAADGFYMMALDDGEQSFFVGIRSTFYRLAALAGESGLMILVGWLFSFCNDQRKAWIITFIVVTIAFASIGLWHAFVLPRPRSDSKRELVASGIFKELIQTFITFFKKDGVIPALLFMLLFRFPEVQLGKISSLFLLDSIEKGGLGLTMGQVAWVKMFSPIGLTLGGILGGVCVSRDGLKRWLWPMVWAISLPDVVYVYLSFAQPNNLIIVSSCFLIEQFGYGFGFTAYMLFLIYYARGKHETAHYAIATAFMAASQLPGMLSGALQEWMGYQGFFIWIMACCAVTFMVSAFLKIDPEFGCKR